MWIYIFIDETLHSLDCYRCFKEFIKTTFENFVDDVLFWLGWVCKDPRSLYTLKSSQSHILIEAPKYDQYLLTFCLLRFLLFLNLIYDDLTFLFVFLFHTLKISIVYKLNILQPPLLMYRRLNGLYFQVKHHEFGLLAAAVVFTIFARGLVEIDGGIMINNLLACIISILDRHIEIKEDQIIVLVIGTSFIGFYQIKSFLTIVSRIDDVYVGQDLQEVRYYKQLELIIVSNKNL